MKKYIVGSQYLPYKFDGGKTIEIYVILNTFLN